MNDIKMTSKMIANKERYLALINSIEVPDANKEELVAWLEQSDFFVAPCTTSHYGSYPGALCSHSLDVYDALVKLVATFGMIKETVWDVDSTGTIIPESTRVEERPLYTDDSIKIVALMHDIGKTNVFTTYLRNIKNDEGKWEQVREYKYKENNERFIYGSHEQNSEFITNTFFPLSVEESSAILNHLGGKGKDSIQTITPIIFAKYPLATLLHTADLLATYLGPDRE